MVDDVTCPAMLNMLGREFLKISSSSALFIEAHCRLREEATVEQRKFGALFGVHGFLGSGFLVRYMLNAFSCTAKPLAQRTVGILSLCAGIGSQELG